MLSGLEFATMLMVVSEAGFKTYRFITNGNKPYE